MVRLPPIFQARGGPPPVLQQCEHHLARPTDLLQVSLCLIQIAFAGREFPQPQRARCSE